MGPLTRAEFYPAATKRVATPSHRTARAKVRKHRNPQHICAEDTQSTEQNFGLRSADLLLRHRQQKTWLQRVEGEAVELVGAARG